ncbi:MAG TPA: lamin tail domain-containing protein [Flavobacteriales bacterium]|nr:lamin tail domain-containing protein [Flavobacteriales bacterium]
MKNLLKFYTLLLFLSPVLVQAQLIDNFTDGDFTNGITWSGNDADWTVVSGQLRSNGPAVTTTTIYLSTPSTAAMGAQWEFYVNPTCATSSGNYMIVTLMSDQANITGSYNGYYVMIGNTADEISLYRKDGASATMIIDGANGSVASSSNNPFRIKVIRTLAGAWTLERDNTGTGSNYFLEGTVTDNTYTSSSFFGVQATYSAANNQKYFFDDLYAGPIIVDVSPPVISSITITGSNSIDVDFNENVELNSSQTVGNYLVNNGIGNPSTAIRDGSDLSLVHLTFGSAFTPLLQNTITINNVEDLFSNAINNAQSNFTYVVFSTAGWRDVVINEIFADPSPSVGLPAFEFIEIHNRSTAVFNLAGWSFSDGSSSATLPSHTLLPGEFVILCPSGALASFSPFGTSIGLSNFPSLNNTGDNLFLLNGSGALIDQVNYSDTWYQNSVKAQGGWTLELINPTLECSGSSNWIASNDNSGGTPGTQNSVYSNAPDITAPDAISVTIVNNGELIIGFNENMDSLSLVNATWTISGLSIADIEPIAPEFMNVRLLVSPAIDSTTAYTLIVSGAQDCSGNSMVNDTLQFAIGRQAQVFEVVIHEIYANPNGSSQLPEYEFVELRNVTNSVLRITGYKFSDATSTVTLPSIVLFPQEKIILVANANVAQFSSLGRTIGLSSLPSLNNSSDVLTLKKADGTIIHTVAYFDTWYGDDTKKNGGWTLEMIDPLNPCNENNNWRASNDPSGGTPGRENSVHAANPDLTAPVPSLVEVLSPTTIAVTFSERMDSLSMLTGNFTITNGINVIAQSVNGDRNVVLTVAPSLIPQTIYYLTAGLSTDCSGNTVASTPVKFAIPDFPQAGDLIINEVLFNPRGSGVDFVEIYNRSDRFITLKDWKIANGQNDTVSNIKTITTTNTLIYPSEYFALTTNPANIISEYPLSATDRLFTVASMPSFNNDAGRVFLITPLNSISDDFSYTDDMHFPLLNSDDGVSLERVDFFRPTSDNTNWHSAAETVGFATPGYKNSQLQPGEVGNTLSVAPKTFSPDNDGYNDVVNISYKFDQAGYTGNITIFDAQGRIVRLLMRNDLLSSEGTISWDGINERREKANTGVYVVYMEVFDLSGNSKHYKTAVVLAMRF